MVALRSKWAKLTPVVLAAVFFALGSTSIGHQDVAALMAQQPAVAERAREHILSSVIGTVHAAFFSLPRQAGNLMPAPQGLELDSGDGAAYGADAGPIVNRAAKGDRLMPQQQAGTSAEPEAEGGEHDELQAAMRYTPFAKHDIALSLELDPQVPRDASEDTAAAIADGGPGAGEYDPVSISISHLFFGGTPMLATPLAIQPWESGEAPIVNVPTVTAPVVAAALPPASQPQSPAPDVTTPAAKEGVTVAGKGVVTGEGRGPKSPAQYLELNAKARTKAERCLSNAIYFEARSEPLRGQIAVAQVVLNRALSGFYPDDVCGVVYQGANRHLSCQFTFACDGIPDVVTEPEHWQRAKRIAREALDGKLWLKEVGKSTHYHAAYVYPYWVRSMRRLTRIGLHSFYRPRAWGNGADEPTWGVTVTADAAAKL